MFIVLFSLKNKYGRKSNAYFNRTTHQVCKAEKFLFQAVMAILLAFGAY